MALRVRMILAELATGPKTNADLQQVFETTGRDVARTMAALCDRGLVSRDIRAHHAPGKGRVATYRLAVVTKT